MSYISEGAGSPVQSEDIPSGYVGPQRCLETLFPDPASRPSLRFFRGLQAKGRIPYLKLGRRTLFDPREVRFALEKRFRRKAALKCVRARGVTSGPRRISLAELLTLKGYKPLRLRRKGIALPA
jgi:hypothetical protein